MASRCGARFTSPPRIATRHAADNNSKWRTTVAQMVPNQGWDYPAVLTASDRPPGSNIKEQGISFAAVKVPTREEP